MRKLIKALLIIIGYVTDTICLKALLSIKEDSEYRPFSDFPSSRTIRISLEETETTRERARLLSLILINILRRGNTIASFIERSLWTLHGDLFSLTFPFKISLISHPWYVMQMQQRCNHAKSTEISKLKKSLLKYISPLYIFISFFRKKIKLKNVRVYYKSYWKLAIFHFCCYYISKLVKLNRFGAAIDELSLKLANPI